jgi:glycosyltransferase involved in cell wall biosynthesis
MMPHEASVPRWLCERLLVVTHVPHFRHQGRVLAYAPYAIEMGEWASLARELVIAAPVYESAPAQDSAAINGNNIALVRLPETGGYTVRAKIRQLALLPWAVASLLRAMRKVDVVHVRCPGNIGLLGALLAPVACRRRIAKYAGQWGPFPNEPWTVRLQRRILRSRWWRAPVLVYNTTRDAPRIVPFFTSVMSAAQVARARDTARQRLSGSVSRILYVGRLTRQKNVAILLRAMAQLRGEGFALECAVVGDGPEAASLLSEARALGVDDAVHFDGARPHDAVLTRYAWADVLVLPSESEGWPKALAEGMAFGLCCVGPNRGIVPWMLGQGRGITVSPGSVDDLVRAIRDLATTGEELSRMRSAAADWGQQYTIERFGTALAELLRSCWPAPNSTRAATRHA